MEQQQAEHDDAAAVVFPDVDIADEVCEEQRRDSEGRASAPGEQHHERGGPHHEPAEHTGGDGPWEDDMCEVQVFEQQVEQVHEPVVAAVHAAERTHVRFVECRPRVGTQEEVGQGCQDNDSGGDDHLGPVASVTEERGRRREGEGLQKAGTGVRNYFHTSAKQGERDKRNGNEGELSHVELEEIRRAQQQRSGRECAGTQGMEPVPEDGNQPPENGFDQDDPDQERCFRREHVEGRCGHGNGRQVTERIIVRGNRVVILPVRAEPLPHVDAGMVDRVEVRARSRAMNGIVVQMPDDRFVLDADGGHDRKVDGGRDGDYG